MCVEHEETISLFFPVFFFWFELTGKRESSPSLRKCRRKLLISTTPFFFSPPRKEISHRAARPNSHMTHVRGPKKPKRVSFSHAETAREGAGGGVNGARLAPRRRGPPRIPLSHARPSFIIPLALYERSVVAQPGGYHCSSDRNGGASVIVRLTRRRGTLARNASPERYSTTRRAFDTFSGFIRWCLAALLPDCCRGTFGF